MLPEGVWNYRQIQMDQADFFSRNEMEVATGNIALNQVPWKGSAFAKIPLDKV